MATKRPLSDVTDDGKTDEPAMKKARKDEPVRYLYIGRSVHNEDTYWLFTCLDHALALKIHSKIQELNADDDDETLYTVRFIDRVSHCVDEEEADDEDEEDYSDDEEDDLVAASQAADWKCFKGGESYVFAKDFGALAGGCVIFLP
jgi:hypothetical protein